MLINYWNRLNAIGLLMLITVENLWMEVWMEGGKGGRAGKTGLSTMFSTGF